MVINSAGFFLQKKTSPLSVFPTLNFPYHNGIDFNWKRVAKKPSPQSASIAAQSQDSSNTSPNPISETQDSMQVVQGTQISVQDHITEYRVETPELVQDNVQVRKF